MSIEELRKISFQKTYNWRVIVHGEGEDMILLASRTTLPLPYLESEPWQKENTRQYFPTVSDIGELSVEFKEDEKGTIRRFFFAWLGEIINDDMTYNYPDEYKRTISVELLSTDGKVNTRYNLLGVFPKKPGDLELDYSTSDALAFPISFSVDSLEVEDIVSGEKRLFY